MNHDGSYKPLSYVKFHEATWSEAIQKLSFELFRMSFSALDSVKNRVTKTFAIAPPVNCDYPKPENILVELVVGPTNTELLATAKMIIHNNDPEHALMGGSLVNGTFIPCWKLYLNGLYTQAETETNVVFSHNGQDPSYCIIEPSENFKTVVPGSFIEIACVSASPFTGISKLSSATNMAGAHISFDAGKSAQFVPLKVGVNESDTNSLSRLPPELCQSQGICDQVPLDTPNSRYSQGVPDIAVPFERRIVPTPYGPWQSEGKIPLASLGKVHADSPLLSFEVSYLEDVLQQKQAANGTVDIFLIIGSQDPADESYFLQIEKEKISIRGGRSGIFYGIQTLRQLLSQAKLDGSQAISTGEISDLPRFPERGTLLDVARHFTPKADLLKYIDLLSTFKINKLHLHLTDNEGWRIEIPGISELVEYSSIRTFNPDGSGSLGPSFGSTTDLDPQDNIENKPANDTEANFNIPPAWQGAEDAMNNFVGMGSGHYTKEDFIEILKYAADRCIDIIPEIDLPAHAGAAIRAMEYRYQKYKDSDPIKASEYRLIDPSDTGPYTQTVVNPCAPGTMNFTSNVFQAIRSYYDAANVTMKAFHIGGDETPGLADDSTWSKSPLCKGSTSRELFSEFIFAENILITRTTAGAVCHVWAEAIDVIRNTNWVIYGALKDSRMVAQSWNNVYAGPQQSACYALANDGFRVLLSHASNLYLDAMPSKHPKEVGTSYAGFIDTEQAFSYVPENYAIRYLKTDFFGDPNNTLGSALGQILDPVKLIKEQPTMNEKKQDNLIGIEAAVWTEAIKNPQTLEYKTFPRIIAVAERAWSWQESISGYIDPSLPPEAIRKQVAELQGEIRGAWQVFANTLGKYTLPMLDFYSNTSSVNYRIQPPGAKIINGTLFMNSIFPGLTLQYSQDQGVTWNEWTKPVLVGKEVLVRTVTKNTRSSRVEKV